MELSVDPLLAKSKQTSSDSNEVASMRDIIVLLGFMKSESLKQFELEVSSSVFWSSSGSMILRCPRFDSVLASDPLLES